MTDLTLFLCVGVCVWVFVEQISTKQQIGFATALVLANQAQN